MYSLLLTFRARIIATVILCMLVIGCSHSSPTPSPPPQPSSSGWTIAFSPGMPNQMKKDSSGLYYFNFPSEDGIHYIYKSAPKMGLGKVITLKFTISGTGTIVPTQGDPPARIRLYIQRKGDTLTAAEEDKRWWSVANTELVSGQFVMMVPVQPEHWFNVFGKNGVDRQAGFKDTIVNAANVGFTFGGMFAGHGNIVKNGNARFTLVSYSIQ